MQRTKRVSVKFFLLCSFPVVQTEDRRMKIELTVRGDTVYIDDDFEFRGLKKLTVYSRKIVGNNNTVHLTVSELNLQIVT